MEWKAARTQREQFLLISITYTEAIQLLLLIFNLTNIVQHLVQGLWNAAVSSFCLI